MGKPNPLASLVGRVLLAALFLFSAVNKLGYWANTAGMMSEKGVPMAHLMLAGAVALELFGGVSILLGWRARLGALALIVFLIPVTAVMHNFWAIADPNQHTQELVNFFKNVSIGGGLLMIIAMGPGPFSLDAWWPKKKAQPAA